MRKIVFLRIVVLAFISVIPAVGISQVSIANKLWVGENNEYIKADSTIIRFETFSKKFGNTRVARFYSINTDTLKLVDSNNDESGLTSNFLVKLNGKSQMTMTPINSGAKQLTNLITLDGVKEKLSYKEIHHFPFDSLKFEKIIFNATECYGRCPAMSLEIKSDENFRFIGGKYSARNGHYSGTISSDQYKQLLEILRYAQLDLVECSSNQNIDLPTYTLEVHYNGRIRYFKTCVLPFVLDDLGEFLLTLPGRLNLIDSPNKFEIKFDSVLK